MYSNKESTKVNSGLCFGQSTFTDSRSIFQVSALVNELELSPLLASPLPPKFEPTTDQLVRRLLSPPPHAFLHGVLSIQWVIGAVGMPEFRFRDSDERYVLAEGSKLRIHGKALGLPAAYLEWLCGDDEEVMSSEQGLCLTPEFFQGIGRQYHSHVSKMNSLVVFNHSFI